MLFKGLKDEDLAPGTDWRDAGEAAKDDVGRWKSVVGIDESVSLADGIFFRVVEWGGMEVFP